MTDGHTHTHTERLLILSVFALQHKGKKKTGHAVHNSIRRKARLHQQLRINGKRKKKKII
jgi:hypothetical protein